MVDLIEIWYFLFIFPNSLPNSLLTAQYKPPASISSRTSLSSSTTKLNRTSNAKSQGQSCKHFRASDHPRLTPLLIN